MKKRTLIISFLIITAFTLLYKYTFTKGTDYIMIKNDSTALVIDNWLDIRRIKSLYNLNYHFYDCCSETGDVMFFIQNPRKYYTINRESDDLYLYNNKLINSLWVKLKNISESNPSHFIYQLELPSQINIDSTLRLFSKDSYRVLIPFNNVDLQPYLRLRVKRTNIDLIKTDEIQNEIEDSLKAQLIGVPHFDIERNVEGTGYGINRNDFIFEFTIRFENNNSLNKAQIALTNINLEFLKIATQDSKFIWLLSKENRIEIVRNELLNKYEFIKCIKYE